MKMQNILRYPGLMWTPLPAVKPSLCAAHAAWAHRGPAAAPPPARSMWVKTSVENLMRFESAASLEIKDVVNNANVLLKSCS